MDEVLRLVLGGMVVASLLTIVTYLCMFLAASASTVLRAHRRDRVTSELDEVLAEILGPRTLERAVERGDAHPN
ncbi:MAG TPA: hypothetical protein VMU75_14770 [Acidimicrobiales bacterium]|nr:hypothetical protein [Acidimicrobiales bacterium]